MFLMLFMMLMMTLIVFNPGLRSSLAGFADPILGPVLPETTNFVVTVLILGTGSMLVNTALRSIFMDPVKQAHMTHRQRQFGKLLRAAQVDRDAVRLERVREMQQRLMPDQMQFQMSAMKPMMFTFVFIIAVFAWMADSVAAYRVDYVSLPWDAQWSFNAQFILFPAWICTYIVMSAPLGRVVDRHLKLIRYRSHPLVLAGGSIPEPLLAEVKARPTAAAASSVRSQGARRRQHTASTGQSSSTGVASTSQCPRCDGEAIDAIARGRSRCAICRHEWRA